MYLQCRELIYIATVCTSSVEMALESNCLYLQHKGRFRKQLFVHRLYLQAPAYKELLSKSTLKQLLSKAIPALEV